MFYQFFLFLQQPQVRGRALKHWTLWTVATALGWALAGFAGLPIGRIVFAESGARAVLSVLATMGMFGTLIGAMIGCTQWLYLRWRIREANWWIPVTAVGWGLGLPLALLLNMLAGFVLSAILYGVVIGAVVGMTQWLLLKRRSLSAGRWIPISMVALTIGISLAGTIDQQLAEGSLAGWEQMRWGTALSGGIAGLFVGLLTGITLLVVLSRKREG